MAGSRRGKGVRMDGVKGEFAEQLTKMAQVEDQLVSALAETAGDVAHTECFDIEQRAEVYAILDSMRTDTKAHRKAVGVWISHRTGEVGDV